MDAEADAPSQHRGIGQDNPREVGAQIAVSIVLTTTYVMRRVLRPALRIGPAVRQIAERDRVADVHLADIVGDGLMSSRARRVEASCEAVLRRRRTRPSVERLRVLVVERALQTQRLVLGAMHEKVRELVDLALDSLV